MLAIVITIIVIVVHADVWESLPHLFPRLVVMNTAFLISPGGCSRCFLSRNHTESR